jgi:AMMECR1 domain-containing protein
MPELGVDISVLSPLAPIGADEIEAGRHGVVLSYHGVAGVLLPQVATEQGWGREQFMDALCRKVGLPRGTWRKPDCVLQGFTAEVFGEDTSGARGR